MGNSHLRLKNYRKAVPYFEKAIELKYQPIPNTHYLLARAYAGTNNDAQSISNLQLAAELGFSGYQRLDSVEFNAFLTTAGLKKAKEVIVVRRLTVGPTGHSLSRLGFEPRIF